MRVAGLTVVLGLAACVAKSPPSTVEETCGAACASKLPRCSETECTRGCNLTLDRIAEREEDRVLDCVGRAGSCADDSWARCATRVGPHADGGPPPPPPPEDFVE
jgi:hypothetical protein